LLQIASHQMDKAGKTKKKRKPRTASEGQRHKSVSGEDNDVQDTLFIRSTMKARIPEYFQNLTKFIFATNYGTRKKYEQLAQREAIHLL
jgi:hypothetical protein